MSYLDRITGLADELGARLDLQPDYDPKWTVAQIDASEPGYPVSPSERARGWVVTGYAQLNERQVVVQGWRPDTEAEAFAVALHELGHIATSDVVTLDPFEQFGMMLGITPPKIQRAELTAWEWAVQHVTPDVLDMAISKSTVSLVSYGIPRVEIDQLHERMRRAAQSHQ